MITNPSQVEALLSSFQRKENLSYEKKMAILEGMYLLACKLGQFTAERPLEGIEHDVQLAASLHSLV